MKRTFAMMALALLAGTAAFADGAAMMPHMVMGKIETASANEVVIVDKAGQETKLALSAKTSIWDKAGKKLAADKLAAGEAVKAKVAADQSAASILVE